MNIDEPRKGLSGGFGFVHPFGQEHSLVMPFSPNADQAKFANADLTALAAAARQCRMGKRTRVRRDVMPHLRAWRDSLGLSRQAVADRIGTQGEHVDQATIAKWERGDTAVRVEDLELLAKVYGVTPDRLFFAPGDARTPEMMRAAHSIITSGDSETVAKWLELGQMMLTSTKTR